MSKSIKVIVSLAFVVFLALAATKMEATRTISIEATRSISYGAIYSGDHAIGCDVHHPQNCQRKEANHYHEGCQNNQHCRTNGSTK